MANAMTKTNLAVRQTAWPPLQLLQPDILTGTGGPPMHTSSASDFSPRVFSYPVPPLQLFSLEVIAGSAAAKLLCLRL